MKVVELLENDQWESIPLPAEEDPKRAEILHRKTVSLTHALDNIYKLVKKYEALGFLAIVPPGTGAFPTDINRRDRLPFSDTTGSLFLAKNLDPEIRAKIVHLIDKHQKIMKLHHKSSNEWIRLTNLKNERRSKKRELNKLKREQSRELKKDHQSWEHK